MRPEHQPLPRHPQRPWGSVENAPRPPVRPSACSRCAAVVRELPPRREHRAALGTW